MNCPEWSDLPGAELVEKGLQDLASKKLSTEAVLLQLGAWRMSQCGLVMPHLDCQPFPEDVLYERLRQEDALSAHERYNALGRRLQSFLSGLERRYWAQKAKAATSLT